jgi:ribose transport system substrate-binding protein
MGPEQEIGIAQEEITRKQLLKWGATAAGGLIVLGGAGCGSSSSSSSSASAATSGSSGSGGSSPAQKAQARLAGQEKPSTAFVPPGPAFDASKAKGSKIYGVFILAIPFAQINKAGCAAGLKAAGCSFVALDGQGQVGPTTTAIEYAISQNPDLIFAETLSGALFAPQFAKAKAKGIPVIMAENQDPGTGWLAGEPPGVVATVNQCHECVGKLMADFTVADSGDKGKAVIIWSADIPGIGKPQMDGIMNEFKALGSQMDVEVKNVPIAQWTTGLPTLTQTLARDENVKYLLPFYDGMVLNILPAVHAAGARDRMKIVTFNATPSVLQSMKSGDVVAADVGANPEQYGWAWADQGLRVLSGVQPVQDIKLPLRTFDNNNIDSIDLNSPQQTWYGNVDFASAYKKLWGVSS